MGETDPVRLSEWVTLPDTDLLAVTLPVTLMEGVTLPVGLAVMGSEGEAEGGRGDGDGDGVSMPNTDSVAAKRMYELPALARCTSHAMALRPATSLRAVEVTFTYAASTVGFVTPEVANVVFFSVPDGRLLRRTSTAFT